MVVLIQTLNNNNYKKNKMDLSTKILSDVTVHMKYAKYVPTLNRRETWFELVTRNKEMHQKKYPQITDEIEKAYEHVYNKTVLPSMRSLQFGGKPIEISPNRLFNCAYLPIDDYRAFSETMFLLLGGTGVGFSVQRHHVEQLPEIRKPNKARTRRFLIGDSIEGWADTIKTLMKAYFEGLSTPDFDYSDIRQKGALLVTSGGKAPGPQPLKDCVHNIKKILDRKEDGSRLEPIEVHDIICFIADAVLTGGIRRAALISLFSIDDEEMLSAKSGTWWELNPQRGRANNSAVILRHKITEETFFQLWKKIEDSNAGEPGVYFSNDKDYGTNPCCFVGDTLVATADGRNAVSIKQLCDENYRGPVYSMQAQTGQVITSYCSNVWKSRENAELVKITLDDNSVFTCTPDHRIMLRNGQYIQAQFLVEGTSLMPFNSYKRSDRNYRMIQSNTGRDIAQYAHVAQYYDIIKEGYNSQHIHHKDGNGLNDLPENLEVMDAIEHNRQHMSGEMNAFHKMSNTSYQTWVEKQSNRQKGEKNTNSNGLTTEEMIARCFDKTVEKRTKLSNQEILDSCGVKFLSKGRLKEMKAETVNEFSKNLAELANHKVVSVEFISEKEDVYDMTVEGTHNFAIITSNKDDNFITSSGVFVHNCEISLRPYSFCNLTEINVSDIESQEDLNNRVKIGSFIGTLQAGYTNFHYLRDIWRKTTEKDALIGVGMTGIGSGEVSKYDLIEAGKIVKEENARVAKLIGINKAARTTTIKPSGTSSLVLGTASGIHAWHNDYYIRRIRVGKNEAIYTYLSIYHPELIEDEYFKPKEQAVISLPVKAPQGSILRFESPMQLLDRVSRFNLEWVKSGHRDGQNTNNVSVTVSIKKEVEKVPKLDENKDVIIDSNNNPILEDKKDENGNLVYKINEWPLVGKWMWDNKENFNGISVLPYDGGSYIQAPFTDCSKKEYEDMMKVLSDIDLTRVIEVTDNTNLSGEVACGADGCVVV